MNTVRNVVVILVDDLGWADIGLNGSTFYETPHIDALGRDGVNYRNAYASAPVCSPTRASLLTGKYPARVGVTQFINGFGHGALRDVPYCRELPGDEFSLARALKGGGRATWHVGKWHLGPKRTWPKNHGFDVNIGGCDSGQPDTYWSPYRIPTLDDGPAEEYLTDRLTDEAISLIDSAGDQPFFLNLWHYAVHTPIQAPPALVSKYREKAARLGLDRVEPIVVGEHQPYSHRSHLRVARRTVQSDPAYAAMIENLDTNVGRLVAALDERGLRESTLIVFTSDNGGLATAEGSPTTNAPLREGKGWLEEGGLRVPFIVNLPGTVPALGDVDDVFTSPDLYPTVLEAAGLDPLPDQHVDGMSAWARWAGERDAIDRGPVFWHYPHYSNQGGSPSAAVRVGRFKLIRAFDGGAEQLFDVVADPGESMEVSDAHPDISEELSLLLEEWLVDVGALIPRRATPYPV